MLMRKGFAKYPTNPASITEREGVGGKGRNERRRKEAKKTY